MVGAFVGLLIGVILGPTLFAAVSRSPWAGIVGLPIGALVGIFAGIWVSLKIASR
jgi:hypothetical protein